MEAVQAHPDRRVIGELDDAPRAPVVVDEAAPGQRFERDPHAVGLCDVADAAQLPGGDLVGVDRCGRDVAAHQDRLDSETLGGGEGGRRAPEIVGERGLLDPLEVAGSWYRSR